MAEIIKMRRMSDTMEEGVIVEWLVQVGDKVNIGDVLAEVETDKATMDFDSQAAGSILHLEAEAGTTVGIGGVIAVIGKEGEDFASQLSAAKESEGSEAPEEAAVPDSVTPDPGPQKVETTPAPVVASTNIPSVPAPVTNDGRVKASPLARKMAEETGVDLSLIQGSGEGGRVVRRDVESFEPSQSPVTAVSHAPIAHGESHDTPVSQMRKAITRRLSESKFTAPHFYLTREIDMDRVVEARKSINDYLGSKVSYNDIIIKAVAAALRVHPAVNSSWLGDVIRTHGNVNIGVATAIDDGLIVPVIKYADQKPISAISAEVKDLATKAREKKLKPEDYADNTFTVSNLGMFGIDEFTAIINSPDACILAIGAIVQKPVVKNGEVVPGNVMKVTLSCDHRVVDGATGAKFLQTFTQFLEEPLRILA